MAAGAPPPKRPSAVLIVDDDEAWRQALADMMSLQGYRVATAGDGVDAFSAMAKVGVPDAIILDLAMPGMDGAEFLEELRDDETLKQVPVLLVTGLHASNPPPVDDLLLKPIGADEVVRRIDRMIAARVGTSVA